MKVALITDTHFGVRIESAQFVRYFRKFYENVFFPYLEENDIKRVIHLGDIVEHRRYINFLAVKELRDTFMMPCHDRGIRLDIIIGNHDAYYKNTNSINALNELYKLSNLSTNTVRYYDRCTELYVDGESILLVPWICADNRDETLKKITYTKARYLLGHLEIAGFNMYKDVKDQGHGMDPSIFSKFETVCSGHYHHKSTIGNINYLGAPYEITWNDYNDPRGFHILDTETGELTFIQNPYTIFNKVVYNDSTQSPEEILGMDVSHLENSIVKLIVSSKKDPMLYEQFVSKLESQDIIDLTPVEDHHHMDSEEYRNDLLEDDELTDPTILFKRVAESYKHPSVEPEALQTCLLDLYHEASTQGVT